MTTGKLRSLDLNAAIDDALRMFDVEARYPMQDIHAGLPLGERFRRIRANYANYQRWVEEGAASWMEGDPYEVGNWAAIFTPIEVGAWRDIRAAGLPLWPQLPVDRFFVDFGNPVVKVALECDGKQWHDPLKDAERDRRLTSLGWVVLRAPGSRCVKAFDREHRGLSAIEVAEREEEARQQTMLGIIEEMSALFRRRAPSSEAAL